MRKTRNKTGKTGRYTSPSPDLLLMREAAEMLGVSTRTLLNMCYRGELRCVLTPGGKRRVPRAEVERLLAGMGLEAGARPGSSGQPEVPPPEEGRVLRLYEALNTMHPSSPAERVAFMDLLKLAARMRTFTPGELSDPTGYAVPMVAGFCDALVKHGLAVEEGSGKYRMVAEVVP